ncbi:MAG: SOS response-associated peptidase family protein [Bacteroidota bacterium]
MCYDVNFESGIELITDYLPDLVIPPEIDFNFYLQAHIQAQAFLPHPVIIMENDKPTLKLFEWGVIASYMNTPEKIKKSRAWMCNARADKILDKSSYWYRIRTQRCLIPVNGIYEHRKVATHKNKIPYHVCVKNEKLLFLPGLYNYSPIADPDTGEFIGTYTMVTRSANGLMKQIHNSDPEDPRMPLFLPFEMAKKWLYDVTDDAIEEILSFEMPSENLEHHPVFTIRGGKLRPDNKSKNEYYEWVGLPEIVVE